MIKKIFSFIFLFLIVFYLSSKPVLACTNGSTQCSGNTLQVCINGSWNNAANCDCGCSNGSCNACCRDNGNSCTGNYQCCTGYCGDGYCADTPPAATKIPTPTAVPCTTCGTPSQVCTYVCQTCSGSLTNGYKNIKCWASQTCKDDNRNPCFTWDNVGAPAYQCPNLCEGVIPTPSSAPIPPECQVWTCWDMGTAQCSVGFPGCPGGVGYCDNCGTDCGTCSGAPPGATPVPTLPVCNPNCFDPIISPCTTTTCYNENCLGNCNQWCRGTKTNDCACAANLCSSQTCTGSCGDNCTGLLNCVPTTLSRFEIRRRDSIWSFTDSNVNGRDITDAQNRLHICDSFLSGESPNPRSVVYVAWLNNANGCGDIDSNSVKIKWLGNSNEIAMSKLDGYQNGPCAYVAYVTYPADTNIPSAQGFQITMKSIIGGVTTGWTTVTPDLKLKVWDCQVPTSGKIYDGSSGQSCPNNGFTLMADDKLGFSSLTFSPDVTAVPAPPSSYGQANLIWTKSYLPLFNGGDSLEPNGDLAAISRFTRLIDLGTGETHCSELGFNIPVNVASLVSPYSSNPSAQIDFSFIRDQEAWYQVIGGGVKGKAGVESGVPITATNKALTLSESSADNGLVSSNNLMNNINGCSDCVWGNPNNWYINQSTNDLNSYNYNYFYNNFYVKAGIGEIFTDWNNLQPNKIYFVNGNLDINSNSPTVDPKTQKMMMIVKGDITVKPEVTRLDGIYIASGNISVGGTNTSELNINGMLYGGKNITLSRGFTDKTENNKNPAVKVNYSPGLIFNLDPKVLQVLTGWREE